MGTPALPLGSPAGNFDIDSGTPLIQTPNVWCTEPHKEIIITYFVRSLTEMSIFLVLN